MKILLSMLSVGFLLCSRASAQTAPATGLPGTETIRIRTMQAGTEADNSGSGSMLACPSNVPVGTFAVKYNGTVTTTSTTGVSYEVRIVYGSVPPDGGLLDHSNLQTNIGSWVVTPGPDGATLVLSVTVTDVQPLDWDAQLDAVASGTVSYDFRTINSGFISRRDSCEFEIIPTTFSGIVWFDADSNGVFDLDEWGIDGAKVGIDLGPSTFTDLLGDYAFSVDLPLPLNVGITNLPPAWFITFPPLGFHTITANGQIADFGVRPEDAAIFGRKWEDLDSNGVIDGGEPFLEGWEIYIDLNNNGEHEIAEPSDFTDSLGRYGFTGLPADIYIVREVEQAGFVRTFPQLAFHFVDLFPGEIALNVDFGNISVPTDAAVDVPGLPSQFELLQSYPNPFNPTTLIGFRLPVRSHARLTVYDALGREIAILVNEELSAGEHEREWDASGLPSGTYLYRLIAGEYADSRKLVLMR